MVNGIINQQTSRGAGHNLVPYLVTNHGSGNGAWYSLSGTDFRRKCFWNAWLCVFCENGKDEDPSSI